MITLSVDVHIGTAEVVEPLAVVGVVDEASALAVATGSAVLVEVDEAEVVVVVVVDVSVERSAASAAWQPAVSNKLAIKVEIGCFFMVISVHSGSLRAFCFPHFAVLPENSFQKAMRYDVMMHE